MPWFGGNDAPFNGFPHQREISDHIEKFVPGTFIVEIKIQIVQDSLRFDSHMLVFEKVGQPVKFILVNILVDDDNGIAQVAPFDQIVMFKQIFQFMEKYKGSAFL